MQQVQLSPDKIKAIKEKEKIKTKAVNDGKAIKK